MFRDDLTDLVWDSIPEHKKVIIDPENESIETPPSQSLFMFEMGMVLVVSLAIVLVIALVVPGL